MPFWGSVFGGTICKNLVGVSYRFFKPWFRYPHFPDEVTFCGGFGMGVRFFLPRKDAAALVCCGNKQGAYGLMRRGLGERVILGCFKRLELGRLFKEDWCRW